MQSDAETYNEFSGLSVGQVLESLQDEFSDLSPSKLRFLEEQGLLCPALTKAGYRKFSQANVDRLRLILTLQKEYFLPLKVIAETLQELDAGTDTPATAVSKRKVAEIFKPRVVLSREELIKRTGGTPELLHEAIQMGLLPALDVYPLDTVDEFEALVRLAEKGISPNHLRGIRSSCERDAQLVHYALEARGLKHDSFSAHEDAHTYAELLAVIRGGVLRRLV